MAGAAGGLRGQHRRLAARGRAPSRGRRDAGRRAAGRVGRRGSATASRRLADGCLGAQPGRPGDRPGQPRPAGGLVVRLCRTGPRPTSSGRRTASRDYVPDAAFGGWAGMDAAREQLRARGACLMVDWVPNHVGPDSPWLVAEPRTRSCAARRRIWPSSPTASSRSAATVFARGKDPYFAPWPDVVQVNAFAPACAGLPARRWRGSPSMPTPCAATWRCSCSTTS